MAQNSANLVHNASFYSLIVKAIQVGVKSFKLDIYETSHNWGLMNP